MVSYCPGNKTLTDHNDLHPNFISTLAPLAFFQLSSKQKSFPPQDIWPGYSFWLDSLLLFHSVLTCHLIPIEAFMTLPCNVDHPSPSAPHLAILSSYHFTTLWHSLDVFAHWEALCNGSDLKLPLSSFPSWGPWPNGNDNSAYLKSVGEENYLFLMRHSEPCLTHCTGSISHSCGVVIICFLGQKAAPWGKRGDWHSAWRMRAWSPWAQWMWRQTPTQIPSGAGGGTEGWQEEAAEW